MESTRSVPTLSEHAGQAAMIGNKRSLTYPGPIVEQQATQRIVGTCAASILPN